MHFSLRGSPCQAEACLAERHIDLHSALSVIQKNKQSFWLTHSYFCSDKREVVCLFLNFRGGGGVQNLFFSLRITEPSISGMLTETTLQETPRCLCPSPVCTFRAIVHPWHARFFTVAISPTWHNLHNIKSPHLLLSPCFRHTISWPLFSVVRHTISPCFRHTTTLFFKRNFKYFH